MATVTERIERTLEEEATTWGIRPVPPEHRKLSGLDFGVLWGDLAIGLLVLVTGAFLVPALGFPRALLAIGVGSVVGCIPLLYCLYVAHVAGGLKWLGPVNGWVSVGEALGSHAAIFRFADVPAVLFGGPPQHFPRVRIVFDEEQIRADDVGTVFLQHGQEPIPFDGLDQIQGDAKSVAPRDIFCLPSGGQHHQERCFKPRLLTYALRKLKSVHSGHMAVEKRDRYCFAGRLSPTRARSTQNRPRQRTGLAYGHFPSL